jgi:hypothetical protein
MTWLRRVGAFWYDFIVGDDWRLAVGVVGGLALTALLAHHGHPGTWWLLPVAVTVTLFASLANATRGK